MNSNFKKKEDILLKKIKEYQETIENFKKMNNSQNDYEELVAFIYKLFDKMNLV